MYGTLASSPKIPICYFCSLESFDTGMPISTFKLIKHFAGHPDFRVSVILPAEGELARHIRQCGVEPHIIPFSRLCSPKRVIAFTRFFIAFPIVFLRIVRYLRANHIAIVHFSDIIDMPFYACAGLAGAKTVAHLRHCIENRFVRSVFQLPTGLFVSKVICISRAVLRFSGLREPRATVVYNPGPDLSLFDPRKNHPAAPGLADNRDIVVAIGKFLRVKGHEYFIRMARLIESRRPGQCLFVIVGNTAPGREGYFTVVRRLINSLGLTDSVCFLDQTRHEQVPAILSRAAVFVHMPNWQEGLGGVVLEAMAMEVPVVAFNCGGIGECFTHGISGYLVNQYDIHAAAEDVMELLGNAALRKKMGLEARKECLSKFSYQRHFSEIESIYRTIFHEKSPLKKENFS
jgi:glycosyltransferase involved in cell wall biosynthesis